MNMKDFEKAILAMPISKRNRKRSKPIDPKTLKFASCLPERVGWGRRRKHSERELALTMLVKSIEGTWRRIRYAESAELERVVAYERESGDSYDFYDFILALQVPTRMR